MEVSRRISVAIFWGGVVLGAVVVVLEFGRVMVKGLEWDVM